RNQNELSAVRHIYTRSQRIISGETWLCAFRMFYARRNKVIRALLHYKHTKKQPQDGAVFSSYYSAYFSSSITLASISRFFAITFLGSWRVNLRRDDNIMRKLSPSSTAIKISFASASMRLNASCAYTCVYNNF